jgi:hypothetical protein
MFSWRCFPFVESAPRAYRLKASNAAPLSSTSAGTFPRFPYGLWLTRDDKQPDEQRARNFAAEHDLAPVFEKYANLFNYACFTASKEIEKTGSAGERTVQCGILAIKGALQPIAKAFERPNQGKSCSQVLRREG